MIRLLWRSHRAPAYRRRWKERFAHFPAPQKKGGLWVHAVSLGEAIAAIPLIKGFLANHPDELVTVTTMTPTGSEKILAAFGDKIFHVYVPYDLPRIVKRFLFKIKPQLAVIIETELWPNLLYYTAQQHIPILLANGRLSERSAKRYARIKPIAKSMLQCFSYLAVQTKIEAARFIKLGIEPRKVIVTGSIKFDTQIPRDLEDKSQGLRRLLGLERLIWIAGSTHEGEEEQVLDAFATVKASFPNLLLILVPRHPERFNKVASLCKKRG